MTYSIIGTGNTAWFLANRLTVAGHKCVGIYGRNSVAARALADSVRGPVFEQISQMQDNIADVCFLAVSDHAINEVAQNLSYESTLLIHTAGSLGIDAISGRAKDCGVLWPVYSIVKTNLPNHRNIPCAWEAGTDKAKRLLLTIAHGVTDVLFESTGEQRRWLHLSAVISNNFTNHLMTICEQISSNNNLPFSTLRPIIEQTFERIRQESPYAIQTGPAIRGDEATIDRHLSLLSSNPDWRQVYQSLTLSIEKMYNVNSKETNVKS